MAHEADRDARAGRMDRFKAPRGTASAESRWGRGSRSRGQSGGNADDLPGRLPYMRARGRSAVLGERMTASTRPPAAYEISEHPFLRGLSPSFLDAISRGATPRTYAVDDFLLHEGGEATHMFLIYAGKVALEVAAADRPRVTIETVGAGNVVGIGRASCRERVSYHV